MTTLANTVLWWALVAGAAALSRNSEEWAKVFVVFSALMVLAALGGAAADIVYRHMGWLP